MTREVVDRFRTSLLKRRENLFEWWNNARTSRRAEITDMLPTSELTECCVPVLETIDETIHRIEHGEFGRCTICHGSVETELLELDFTTCVCLDHYSAAERRDLEKELEMAARLQQDLFPSQLPSFEWIQAAAHAAPARILSGDFYDFIQLADGSTGVVLADVMGKGIPAGILMSNIQASLRTLGPDHSDLCLIMSRLNGLFRFNVKALSFISLFLLALDEKNGTFRYCNAGQNPPLLFHTSTGRAEWLKPTGPALGIVAEPHFKTVTGSLERGDILVLYTDGVVESTNSKKEAFGEDRLLHFVAHHSDETADRLLHGLWHTLVHHSGDSRPDDRALLVFKHA